MVWKQGTPRGPCTRSFSPIWCKQPLVVSARLKTVWERVGLLSGSLNLNLGKKVASPSQGLWRPRPSLHLCHLSLNSQMCLGGGQFAGLCGKQIIVFTPKGLSALLGRPRTVPCDERGGWGGPGVWKRMGWSPHPGHCPEGRWHMNLCTEVGAVWWRGACRWEVAVRRVLDYRKSICRGLEERGSSLGARRRVPCAWNIEQERESGQSWVWGAGVKNI